MSIKLSLVIPIYNAESFIYETLVKLVEWKQNVDYGVEVILINDGSTDNTDFILKDFIRKNPILKLISYSVNKGKGYAVKMGMLEAKGEFKIFTDADIPYGVFCFDNIIYHLDFNEFDVCIGNRESQKSEYFVKMGFFRKLSSKIFTLLTSWYIETEVKDTQCGLKGFRANVADEIFSKLNIEGFAFDVEIIYLCFKYDYGVKKSC